MWSLVVLTLVCLVPGAAVAIENAKHGEETSFTQGRVISDLESILPQRRRVEVTNAILEDRLDNLLPRLMRETGIDLWLAINREYAEDPVYLSLVPEPVFAARRTTMLVFFDRGTKEGVEQGVERLTVSRYPFGKLYQPAWEGGDEDEQWRRLAEIVRERNPRSIAIDKSRHWPVADGLTASLEERLLEALAPELASRVVSAESLVIRWIESRTGRELELYPQVVALVRSVIAEAFSERVITPGATTAADVEWYIRERFSELELPVWFMPSLDIQRRGVPCEREPFCGQTGEVVIERGDVLHTDVGICYLRLCSDTQEMGYVLRLGEESVPEDLVRALRVGNRWQDLLTGNFVTGLTGNQILERTRSAAEAEGIRAMTYTHPLGPFGHSLGPTVGMWDNQGPTPVRGDWPLHPATAYAIEGNVRVEIAAWEGQPVLILLEQSAVFDGERVIYLAGRQVEWHTIQ